MLGRRRNRRKERIKRAADNRLTELYGVEVHKLTGSSDCWIVPQERIGRLPTKKVAYACFNGFQRYEMARSAKRMSLLRVKQSCGVHQCVNPEHLVGTEKPFKPWG